MKETNRSNELDQDIIELRWVVQGEVYGENPTAMAQLYRRQDEYDAGQRDVVTPQNPLRTFHLNGSPTYALHPSSNRFTSFPQKCSMGIHVLTRIIMNIYILRDFTGVAFVSLYSER